MAKYLPHGTTVRINSQIIGGLISVSIPDRTRGAAEVTDSASAFDREYIPGLREGGTVQVTFRHNPDDVGQQQLETNFNANGAAAVVGCSIVLPDVATAAVGSRTYSFQGFVIAVTQGDLNLVDDQAAEMTATIKISDATIAVG